jgi:hypothetical protein
MQVDLFLSQKLESLNKSKEVNVYFPSKEKLYIKNGRKSQQVANNRIVNNY